MEYKVPRPQGQQRPLLAPRTGTGTPAATASSSPNSRTRMRPP